MTTKISTLHTLPSRLFHLLGFSTVERAKSFTNGNVLRNDLRYDQVRDTTYEWSEYRLVPWFEYFGY